MNTALAGGLGLSLVSGKLSNLLTSGANVMILRGRSQGLNPSVECYSTVPRRPPQKKGWTQRPALGYCTVTPCYLGGGAAPHMHMSSRVSRSCMTHLIVPAGLCNEALPEGGNDPEDRWINTRRSAALWISVKVSPIFDTLATPVKIVP